MVENTASKVPLGVKRKQSFDSQNSPGYGDKFDCGRAFQESELQALVQLILQEGHLNSSSRLIDAGCGTGRLSVPLSTSLGYVVGIDANPEMLNSAKKKESKVDWRLGDLLEIESILGPDMGSFDCILLSSVLQQISCPEELIGKLTIALKCSGYLLIRTVTPAQLEEIEWLKYFPRALEFERSRTHSLHEVEMSLAKYDFQIESVTELDGREFMSLEQLISRFRNRGYSWCSLYSSVENEKSLQMLETEYRTKTDVVYEHPTSLIAAKRR